MQEGQAAQRARIQCARGGLPWVPPSNPLALQQAVFPSWCAGIAQGHKVIRRRGRTRARPQASWRMAVLVWGLLAIVCIGLGLIGILLPVLPTVPFLLAAAAAASRGWPWLDQRLVSHPLFGPAIVRWRERGAVPRRAKWFA